MSLESKRRERGRTHRASEQARAAPNDGAEAAERMGGVQTRGDGRIERVSWRGDVTRAQSERRGARVRMDGGARRARSSENRDVY